MDQRRKVKKFIASQGLLRPGDMVVLAVSGGVDSVVMAHIMAGLRRELGFEAVVATFDHKLRPTSGAEAAFVAAYAKSLGLVCYEGSEDVSALASGHNLEDTARRARYAFLRRVAFRQGGAAIATAHHRDDQAETVLMHLLRGSGPPGLAAMSPAENGVIRPLLPLDREEIEAYAKAQGLEWREDESNASTALLRNRVRLELLPQLADYNPRIMAALNATADICREEDALLDDMAENALAELFDADSGSLREPGFASLPLGLQRRVVRKAFCLVAGEGPELSFSQVEAILGLKEEQSTHLPGDLIAYRRQRLALGKSLPELPSYQDEYPLQLDGQWHELGDWGWSYKATPEPAAPARQAYSFRLPMDEAAGALWRTRRPGDAVPSSGISGREKLKDIFIDAHIPREQRQGWPLLISGGAIRWAPRLWRDEDLLARNGRYVLIKAKQYDNI